MTSCARFCSGYTYVELLLAITIGGVLVLGLGGVIDTSLTTADHVGSRSEQTRAAAAAMDDMRRALAHSSGLALPLADNPATDWPEHIRVQTVPASAPVGSSTFSSAVLALALPAYVDLNHDGIPDADNDGDGRIDEDLPSDNNNDGAAGIIGIDDNGDGRVDNSAHGRYDDDEDGVIGIETLNSVDDDGDGSVDEDLHGDANRDGSSGVAGVDDDGDGSIDESASNDDDEDGSVDEDWFDALVYYLDGDALKRRTPVPWDIDGDGSVDGTDFATSTLVDGVTRFRVERVVSSGARLTVGIELSVAVPGSDERIDLSTRVRLGGAR